jgi:transposase
MIYLQLLYMAKRELKFKAVELRGKGFSYTDIKEKIGVSKSTLSDWLKSIKYQPNKFVLDKFKRASAASSRARTRIRLESDRERHYYQQKRYWEKPYAKRSLVFRPRALYGRGVKDGNGSGG